MVHLLTPSRGTPHRGCPSSDGLGQRPCNSSGTLASGTVQPPSLGGHLARLGQGPHRRAQRRGHRYHQVRRVFPPCAQWSITCAPADLCLPTRVRDRLGALFQAAGPVPTHVSRVARRPGPVEQSPTGRGRPGLRQASLVSALTPSRCRRRQAHILPEWSGVIDAGPVAACGDGGDRPGPRRAWRAAPTGQSRPAVTWAWRAWSRRWRRAVGSVSARTSSWQTRCGAGVGPTTARRQRRGAGPPVARPVERRAGRSRHACRRTLAVVSSWRVSARARRRSRRAASAPAGTSTGGRAPERRSRASGTASRRSVFTRSPAVLAMRAGATPQQTWPLVGSSR